MLNAILGQCLLPYLNKQTLSISQIEKRWVNNVNNMKHAYLIIAHNEPFVLQTLLSLIDDRNNDVFLHIDKRSELLYRDIKS